MACDAAPPKPVKRAPDAPVDPPRPATDAPDSPYSPYDTPPDSPDDDDDNASLRSQALNADGTPKRPMNAFMIFARRRRPQVSAANQMMRTGEISKILSREWNTMSMTDKTFYLDQAKKLKESFNSKYPDYVYRRRPNNSRKKRRTDPSTRGVDAYGDPRDDSLSPHEHSPTGYHSVSPIDALAPNEQSISLAAQGYRLPYAGAHHHFHSDSGYPYYAPHHPHRLAHHPSPYDASPASSASGAALSPLLAGLSYVPAHSPAIYHPDDDAHIWAGGAFPRLDPPVKLESAAWAARRRAARPGEPYPSHAHAHAHTRHWSDGGAATGAAHPGGGFPSFQTLTAPFFPSSGTVSPSTASSSSAASHASSYFGAVGPGQAQAQAQDREPTSFDAHAAAAPPFAAQGSLAPRAYAGPTVGSTLALSPSAAWSSVRTKSEL